MINGKKILSIEQVAQWRLCLGCGACVSVCKENAISMVDVEDVGLRPRVDSRRCQQCHECISVCPGVQLSHTESMDGQIPELSEGWGPVLEIWEGWAVDEQIRLKSSSGGAATALSLFCLEKAGMAGVLHTAADADKPWANVTVMSRNRGELLAGCGSRYAPASPGEKFNQIAEESSPCVFVGKPCDAAALGKARKINAKLDAKIGLAVSIFCAGTPSTKGTFKLLEAMGTEASEVARFDYRGNGWPGQARAKLKGAEGKELKMSYEESWGKILSRHVQLRCRLCPDGTGEFADIAVGDPWYRKVESGEPGRSLVLVRTEKGREIVHKAMQEGYLQLEQVEADVLPRSQGSLLWKRRNLRGRLWAMRLLGVPVPCYEGFSLKENWKKLSFKAKVRAVFGTIKRFVSRGWLKPWQGVNGPVVSDSGAATKPTAVREK